MTTLETLAAAINEMPATFASIEGDYIHVTYRGKKRDFCKVYTNGTVEVIGNPANQFAVEELVAELLAVKEEEVAADVVVESTEEAALENVSFSVISPATTDFDGFKHLSKPYCTLIEKISDTRFKIKFEAPASDVDHLLNETCIVEVRDEYIYDTYKA